MPRKKSNRFIERSPGVDYYKPAGIPMRSLEEVVLHFDEFEAIRLADLEGIYHEEASAKMKVSRQTFGRIINEAHRKIAEAIINGKAIRINKRSTDILKDATLES